MLLVVASTGSVDVTLGEEVFFTGTLVQPVLGTLKGVAGTMVRVGERGTLHRCTRTAPGEETPVGVNSVYYRPPGRRTAAPTPSSSGTMARTTTSTCTGEAIYDAGIQPTQKDLEDIA